VGNYIPQELIETIREQSDLVEVIGEYLRLTKKGKDYVALCPFHQEKTPSFTVSREKQIFHCFGCGRGGNVFHFLMFMENLTFPEAIRLLSSRTGIAIPVSKGADSQKKAGEESRVGEINALAADFYRQFLADRTEGAGAREYLVRRGLNKETIQRFGLGYAPNSWHGLLNYLLGHNYSGEEIVAAGLAVTGESGKAFDRFRQRIIFPIANAQNKIVGFGGRILGEGEPKYLNSPETAVFNKRHLLYGLNFARPAIREQGFVIIMEGYLDVLSAHQAGINNSVASLGTSLTDEQGKLLKRYTTEVVIAYDADAAGVAATLRSLDMLQGLGFRVRVVSIPQGKDPDEYIRSQGRQAWDYLVERAPALLEYKIDQAYRITSDKKRILQQVITNLASITSLVEQEEGIKLIATRLNLSWNVIKSELDRFLTRKRLRQPIPDKIANKTYNILLDAQKIAEQEILRLVLQKHEYLTVVNKELSNHDFEDPVFRKIYQFLEQQSEKKQRPADWMEQLTEQERELTSRLLIEKPPLGDSIQALMDFIKTIKANAQMRKRSHLLQELAQAERKGEQERLALLLEELGQLLDGRKQGRGP
jgi:DNA primase